MSVTSISGRARGATATVGHLLDHQSLIVCVGSGGVGKTTMAAALAIAAARRGRRTAVLTIDPARRLQDALGIEVVGGAPHRVRVPRRSGEPVGRLDAMVLDAKHTFDTLIHRYAPSPEIAARVLDNRIYQSLSGTLAGSQEYMAMERIHEIVASASYDLLIVDTPPSQHALDFFEAPDRMSALLSSRAATLLQNPSLMLAGGGSRFAQAMLTTILRGLERFTGLTLLRDLADFAGSLDTYSEGFRTRAAAVAAMLREPATSYLLVTTPEPARIVETLTLRGELARTHLPVAGVIVNRVLPAGIVGSNSTVPRAQTPDDLAFARKLTAVHRRYARLAREERREIARLARQTNAQRTDVVVEVPLQTIEPTSLSRLVALAEALI